MKQQILKLLSGAEGPVPKSVIAKALKVKGPEARAQLRDTLKALEKIGEIERKGGRNYTLPERLPSVAVVEVTDIDMDGDVIAVPAEWAEEYQGERPRVEMKPPKKGHPAFAKSERILAKLEYTDDGIYIGQALKRLSTEKNLVLGTLEQVGEGYVLRPVDKKARYDFMIPQADLGGAEIGDLVSGEVHPASRGSAKKQARIVEVLGSQDDPKIFSLVAIHERSIPHVFPDAVLKECEGLKVPELGKRQDLRDLPLVTIDGADARDFDDAVFAEADSDPKNPGGYHIIVAIADVSHYVRPGSQLDREALKRGNSTYFPDRVVPMLPEALSNDLCSLRPDEERAAMAMHMWIDREGKLLRYKPVRALIKSSARLIYEQVQAAKDGNPDEMTAPLMNAVIEPLYAVYDILDKAREERGALDLDLPERQILVNEKGEMTGVQKRTRLDAHKLIEEMMILANVATALALEDKKAPCLYRVHDRPDGEKLDSVRGFIEGLGLSFPKGQVVQPENLNRLLKTAKNKGEEDGIGLGQLVSQVVLRCQSQAVYSPDNNGHFGLALCHYAHFTSPIRRYADLFVHRALIKAYGFGDGHLSDEEASRAAEIADLISGTERRSMEAERSAVDRFTAAYLAEQEGATFTGRISGVTRFGLFVTLDENGADGIIPMRSLKDDYYYHDEKAHALIGKRKKAIYRLCAPVTVKVVEADGMTGSVMLEIVGKPGAEVPGFQDPFKGKRRPPGDKPFKKGGFKGKGKPKGPFKHKKKKQTTPKHKRKR